MNENKDFFWQEEERPEVPGEELETQEQAEETPMETVPETSPDVRETVEADEEDAFFCGSYRGTGAGRKESPFADSPYVRRPARDTEPYLPRYEEIPEAEHRTSERKKNGGFLKKFLAWTAALALVVGSCAVTAHSVNQKWEDRAKVMEDSFSSQIAALQQQVAALTPENTGDSVSGTVVVGNAMSASQVYARNVRSVVLIEATITTSLFGQTTTGKSSGSGFILSEDGYVVTNFHVVEGATSVEVGLYDGTSYPAALVGYDSTNDLAVLKVDAQGLDAVELGSSDELIVGVRRPKMPPKRLRTLL